MNKKTSVITACATFGVLLLPGCSNGSYEYELSGTVEAGRVDYDCPDDTAMAPVGFTPGSRPKPVTIPPQKKKPSDGSGTGAVPQTPKASSPKKSSNSGVKLDSEPEKPERIHKVPTVKYLLEQKGCEIEYELFVKNDEGLFEQDVRRVDYDKCMDGKRELFPACTKN